MSMMQLTRIDYASTRTVYVNSNHVATVERVDYYTRIELSNGSNVKVTESVSAILVQMGEWDMADSAARDQAVA